MRKLIRDRIFKATGGVAKLQPHQKLEIIADKGELMSLLKDKVIEELEEFYDNYDVGEMGDLLEVITAIVDLLELDHEEIKRAMIDKRNERGQFKEGVVLVEM